MKKMTFLIIMYILALHNPGVVIAQSSSSNYRVDEAAFSSGSGTGDSASFSSRVSAGDVAVGSSFSTSYQSYSGPISPDEEYLEFIVNAATIELDTASGDPGILSATEVATGSATFYVRAYLNSGYVVRSYGPTLTNESSATISALSTTAPSSTGNEQFGINLVDNSSPDIGADATYDPSNSFADGEAAPGYDTPDQFAFVSGDVIAQNGNLPNNPAWGQTNYTISYISNISSVTEAGSYTMTHTLVATPTY